MSSFVVNLPVKIVFGRGEISNLPTHVRPLGDRAFLIADPYWVQTGLADRVRNGLVTAGIDTVLFGDASPNPVWQEIDRIAELVRQHRSDFLIGLGGGSAIDTAKAVAVAATHEGSIDLYVNWQAAPRQVTDAVLPTVAIPTTSGTGAEVTQAAVLSDPRSYRKTAVFNDRLYPRIALVDPELAAMMPRWLTAATGLDALSHAMEGLLNTQRRSPFADMVGLEAIRLIAQYLPRACDNGADMEARENMAWGAVLGGVSIAQSGTTVPHALGQPLGARKGVHHGVSIAAFLPAILERSWEADPVLFSLIGEAMGVCGADLSVGAKARGVSVQVRELMARTGLDREIAKVQIEATTVDEIIADATSYLVRLNQRHIRPLTTDEMRAIITSSVSVR